MSGTREGEVSANKDRVASVLRDLVADHHPR